MNFELVNVTKGATTYYSIDSITPSCTKRTKKNVIKLVPTLMFLLSASSRLN